MYFLLIILWVFKYFILAWSCLSLLEQRTIHCSRMVLCFHLLAQYRNYTRVLKVQNKSYTRWPVGLSTVCVMYQALAALYANWESLTGTHLEKNRMAFPGWLKSVFAVIYKVSHSHKMNHNGFNRTSLVLQLFTTSAVSFYLYAHLHTEWGLGVYWRGEGRSLSSCLPMRCVVSRAAEKSLTIFSWFDLWI